MQNVWYTLHIPSDATCISPLDKKNLWTNSISALPVNILVGPFSGENY